MFKILLHAELKKKSKKLTEYHDSDVKKIHVQKNKTRRKYKKLIVYFLPDTFQYINVHNNPKLYHKVLSFNVC